MKMQMPSAESLKDRYALKKHTENGSFIEKHYISNTPGRADSGSIYYYVAPDERTEFHRIDCGEYWCYNAGSPLEVWQVGADENVLISNLGIDDGCEPMIYIKPGVIFAARHKSDFETGTFLTCITVPRFSYNEFELFSQEQMRILCPDTADFYRKKHA